MSSEENTLFDNITTLIDKNDYAKAENELKLIISTETSSEEAISYAHYLIGYINTCWRNEDKKESLAKRMLLACINSNYPFPNAYFLYANQEEDKNIACNYLKAGLSKFPKSAKIYLGILNHCPKNETINYINEIDDKNIIDIDLFNKVIEILIAISNWEKVEVFINKLLKQKYISEHYYLYYKMLYSLSLVKQNKDIERAKELFLEVIGKDLSNDLNYSPYMGYIWCCIKMNMSEEAIKYFDKIPISNGLGDLHNGLNNISVNLDFIDIYIHIFREIGNIFKDDKKRMLRLAAMEAFYLYKPSEITENYRYTKKNLAALKRYIKTDSINMDIYCAIFNMQKHFNLYFDAYKTYMQMLNEQLNPLDGYIYIDFFDESSAQENERIYLDILGVLDTGYYLDYDGFVSGVFDCIVEYLFNLSDKKRYNKICALADKVKYKYLDKSAELFKVAYSYAELDNKCKKAERLYLLLLENQPNSTAV
ncbi:MAG: hypothetical protein GX638_06070, partial [Crenarchaeota archaeon]|nr:hypothetical protein [Thermoproteota archaeon]